MLLVLMDCVVLFGRFLVLIRLSVVVVVVLGFVGIMFVFCGVMWWKCIGLMVLRCMLCWLVMVRLGLFCCGLRWRSVC